MRVRNSVMTVVMVAGTLVAGVPGPAAAAVPAGVAFVRSTLDTGGQAYGIEIADVTGEGRADLIVTHHATLSDPALAYKVLVYPQGAGGGLQAPVVYTPSVSVPGADTWLFPAVGDLDGDGDTDLLVGHQEGFDLFYQDAGVFTAPLAFATVAPVHEIEVADLNADGLDDIVYSMTGAVSGYRYRGRFQDALDNTIGAVVTIGDAAAETFAVGDVTGDAKPDVVPEGDASGTVFVHDAGDETFTAAFDTRITDAVSLAVADVNDDTRNDLVLLESSGLSVLPGQPDGSLADATSVGGPFTQASALEVADLNADAALDVVVFGSDGTHAFVQDDAGMLAGLTCAFASVLESPAGGNETVAIGDLNGDARPDAAGADEGIRVRLLRQQVAGSLVATVDLTPPSTPVEFGDDIDLAGQVETPGGVCGASGEVQIERTLPGGVPEIIATTALSPVGEGGASASFAFADPAPAVGDVSYRVLWGGDTFHAAAASDPATVEVLKRSSSLSLQASDTSIISGHSSTLTAFLTGGDRPATVSFFKIVDGVRKPVGTAPVDGGDEATLVVSPTIRTVYIATYTATETARGATSNKVTVDVSKRESSLSLFAPAKISFGRAATLSADLSGGGSGVRRISFYAVIGTTQKLLGRVTADTKGRADFIVKPRKNASYVATYAGNAVWSPATSPTRTVKVSVLTTGSMVHFGHKQNGIAFYVCCTAYFAFEVAPNHAGDRVLVESQYLAGHTWKSFDGSMRYFRLRANSTQEIFTTIAGGEPYRFRIRACMDAHADHEGDCSNWVGFRFE
ncbi:MAG: VCBS repeat-containing protein [Actinomycetota bacterium]